MRKGSSRAHADWPRLRRSLTPAPSEVGTASMTRCSVREFMVGPSQIYYLGAARQRFKVRGGRDESPGERTILQRMSSDETGSIEPYETRATPVVTTVIPAYLGTN